MNRSIPLGLMVLLGGCSGDGGAGADGEDTFLLGDVVAIRVVPEELTLTTTATSAATQQFTLEATFRDGTVEEDFPIVEWELSNTTAGEIDKNGLFSTSTSNGGRTLVTANVAGYSASAQLTVIFDEVYMDAGVSSDMVDAIEATEGTESPALAFTYPEDGTALPRNLPEMEFMWAFEGDLNVYRVSFTSSTTNVRAYTTTTEWTAPEDLWRVITSTNSGDEVQVDLAGASMAGSTVQSMWLADPIGFRVSRFDAEGAVYYWSTTDQGVVRAEVDKVDPQLWFSKDLGNAEGCVGCHVISQDGDRLAFTWARTPDAERFTTGLASIDAEGASPEAVVPWEDEANDGAFSTIDPTGTWRITDNGGTLQVYDAADGQYLFDVPADIPLTMPDWSPDGKSLLAVTAADFKYPNNFGRGEIVKLPHLGEALFGEPEILVAAQTVDNQYYPMFSPDSQWVAFNRAKGASYFNEDAALWLVSAAGGDPIELERANLAGSLTNSWPRWAPMPDDDILWLAFASTRSYGNFEVGTGTAQIWVTAIDTYVAEDGVDPSLPSYRLVQQDLETSNHTPWWSRH